MISINQLGSFLVWQDRITGKFCLTIRDQTKARHYHIYEYEDGTVFATQHCHFRSICELVKYHSQNEDLLCTKLIQPCIGPHCVISQDKVNFIQQIPSNESSEVWKGEWNGKSVAINKVKPNNIMVTQVDLLNVCTFLRSLEHKHLIQFLATCIQNEPFLVITEYLSKGSLKQYLSSEAQSLSMSDLTKISAQVASAMSYLEKSCCIHQDLSAKNVAIEVHRDNKINCKLNIYPYVHQVKNGLYCPEHRAISVRWSPPEVIVDNQISIKSNVWSFGITVWEMTTYCQRIPYSEMTESEVLEKVYEGYRMSRPLECPEELYELMQSCWKENASSRPTFQTLCWQLDYYSSGYINLQTVSAV